MNSVMTISVGPGSSRLSANRDKGINQPWLIDDGGYCDAKSRVLKWIAKLF